jgi:hypothetical protein
LSSHPFEVDVSDTARRLRMVACTAGVRNGTYRVTPSGTVRCGGEPGSVLVRFGASVR